MSHTYNADGTLAIKHDANGNTLNYSYDTYGRLTSSPAGTFSWDTCPANDDFCTSTPGQLVEAVFGSNIGPNKLGFQYDYTYTPAGAEASKSLTVQSTLMPNQPATGTDRELQLRHRGNAYGGDIPSR